MRLSLALAMALAMSACQPAASPTPSTVISPPTPTTTAQSTPTGDPAQTEAVERGRALFFSQSCYICHGERGEGDLGPALAGTGLTFADVRRQLRNPRELMPAYIEEILSDDQIRDLYAFERSLPKP